MSLRGRPEITLDPEVDGHVLASEPAAAPAGQSWRLRDLAKPEHRTVEPPGIGLAAGRHGKLDVVDPDDLDHVGFGGFGFGFGGFGFGGVGGVLVEPGFLALGPAVAAFQASMSWPAHGS